MKKVYCYECKWRGDVSGSAHSCCNHPSLSEVSENPTLKLMSIFAGVGRTPAVVMSNDILNIKANHHGVERGWFTFPFNFDPVWLENCDGFKKKIKKEVK